jgi:hypothetical protein
MSRYTIKYSVEVVVSEDRNIRYRIVDTGIGWVGLASAETLRSAMHSARHREPNADFVRHKDDVHVVCDKDGKTWSGYKNMSLGRDETSRKEQYAAALEHVATIYGNNPFVLQEVERALKLAFPARYDLLTA